MRRKTSNVLPLTALFIALGLIWISATASGQGAGYVPSTQKGDWPYYTADLKGTKYSPLDQVNASNFGKLEVAWRFKTDNLGPRPEYKLEGTPLAINGTLYTTGGTRRSIISLDGKTGEVNWAFSFREGNRAAIAARQLSGRGVSYWTDGKGDDRVVFVSTGYRLLELNAHTGAPITTFGTNGMVDLKVGMVTGAGQQIDLETGEAGLHSTPLVVKDVAIVGSSFKEGMTPVTHNNTKGLVRAFDIKTGKLLWTFNTIPRPGEFGNETWENGSWAQNGNTGVWTQMTVDEELGLVYLPVEDPTSDYYGGHRPGNNLFGDSLVCVDLKTGKRKWHYQIVHHPIWDYDLSSAPILADINVNGKAIKAVALPTKEAYLYVFDRVTGEPVWPIEEKPVQASDVPGEKASPTQPFPSKPPAYARNFLKVPDDLIDFTPEMRNQAKDILGRYRVAGMFNPPLVGDGKGLLGAINVGNAGGGTNWPGAGYDPVTHIVYAQAANSSAAGLSLRKPPQGFSDLNYFSGRGDQPFREALGPGFGSAADSPLAKNMGRPQTPPPGAPGGAAPPVGALIVEGLPIMKPPYGVISAVNLDRGDLQWQVPYGETPDNVRRVLTEKGIKFDNLGQNGSVGLLVTKTLVILGDAQVTNPGGGGHPRGAMLRAYDKATGKAVGAVWMPAPQSGSPMTYMANGKQFIIVSVSGGAYSGEYIAYALPEAE